MSGDDELHGFRRLLLLGLLGGGLTYAAIIARGAPMLSVGFALGAGFMVALGGFNLWEDIFVGPMVRALRRHFLPPPQPARPRPAAASRRRGGRVR